MTGPAAGARAAAVRAPFAGRARRDIAFCEGLRAALELRRAHPGTAVLVLSQYIETRYAAELLRGNPAGVGYLPGPGRPALPRLLTG